MSKSLSSASSSIARRYVFRRLTGWLAMVVDSTRTLDENERSHIATETGMLRQDFSAINVSMNKSWVTGRIEITVLAPMDVVNVWCLMSLNRSKLFSTLS